MWNSKKGLKRELSDGPELIVYFSGEEFGNKFSAQVVSPNNPKHKHGYWKEDWNKENFESL